MRSEAEPLRATVRSMVAAPAPEQSGVDTDQAPPGAGPACASNPSHPAAAPHPGAGVVGAGVVGGEVDGGRVVGGRVDGGGVAGVGLGGVGDGVSGVGVGPGVSLQETPLNRNAAGAVAVPDDVPWNPNRAEAPVASAPFHPTLAAVTVLPLCVTTAFQALVTR